MKNIILTITVTSFIFITASAHAQGIEEWSHSFQSTNNLIKDADDQVFRGFIDISDTLFVGTSTNASGSTSTLNDAFSVDVDMNTAQSILSGNGVWGATADPDNERILFTQSSATGFGDNLFALPYTDGGTPVLLGNITLGGVAQRIDGLAMRNGVLYGFEAGNGATNGFYQIDLQTFEATLIAASTESISGIDADPETCIIYGVNDTAGQVVTLDTNGNITNLVAYPVGITDIDGIAVGGGYAYLVTDEAGDIAVLDLSTLTYDTSLTSPFTAADTFSAGALAVPSAANNLDLIYKNGFEFNSCADIQ